MYIIDSLAYYGQKLHDKGLVISSGGNISARDSGYLVIKKKGADMSTGAPENYTKVQFSEIERSAADLSSETASHLACYQASKDIKSVVHVHSPYIIACADKTDVLENVSYEFDCMLDGPVPVVDFISPGSESLGEAVGAKVKEGANAVILKKHGSITVGTTIEEAYYRALALERAAKTFLHS